MQLFPHLTCMTLQDMDDVDDSVLLNRAIRGEAEAFGELIRRYQTSVFNVCYRLVGDRGEAEDLAQEAFIRAYQRLNTFDRSRPFGPWIKRVAVNVCLNRLERTAPILVPLDENRDRQQAEWGDNPEIVHEATERTAALRMAILALPPRYRAVIELRHIQELSYAEIAVTLNIPLSDVKSHLFRARRLLAAALREYT